VHDLDSFGFSLQLPRVEEVLNTPVHGILGEPSHQGALDPHLILIPPPSPQVVIEDAPSLLLKGLYHFLDAVSPISQALLVPHVAVVLQVGEKLPKELVFEEGTELMHEKTFKTAPMDLLGRSLLHKGPDAHLVPPGLESTQSFLESYLVCHAGLKQVDKLCTDSPIQPLLQ
jgi:hypothetical protein